MEDNASLVNWLVIWEKQKPGLEKIYQSLREKYNEPHRYYHNLEHISTCLKEYSDLKDLAKHPFEVEIAIWFHDVIYNTRQRGNEEKSAEYAHDTLHQFVKDKQLEEIQKLILITKHDSEPKNIDEKILIDVDLAIFGQQPEQYNEYEKKIREEYSWIPEQNFWKGRIKLLKNFLDREFIFYTEDFRSKYEEQARRNLQKSISLME